MTLKKLLIFLLIISSNIALADDALYLNKDDKAPFSGYLMPKEKVLDLRNAVLERDTLRLQNDSLNVSLKLQDDIIAKKDQQLTLYGDQMDKMAKTAYSNESLSTWGKIGYIALGIGLTGLAISGVHALYR